MASEDPTGYGKPGSSRLPPARDFPKDGYGPKRDRKLGVLSYDGRQAHVMRDGVRVVEDGSAQVYDNVTDWIAAVDTQKKRRPSPSSPHRGSAIPLPAPSIPPLPLEDADDEDEDEEEDRSRYISPWFRAQDVGDRDDERDDLDEDSEEDDVPHPPSLPPNDVDDTPGLPPLDTSTEDDDAALGGSSPTQRTANSSTKTAAAAGSSTSNSNPDTNSQSNTDGNTQANGGAGKGKRQFIIDDDSDEETVSPMSPEKGVGSVPAGTLSSGGGGGGGSGVLLTLEQLHRHVASVPNNGSVTSPPSRHGHDSGKASVAKSMD